MVRQNILINFFLFQESFFLGRAVQRMLTRHEFATVQSHLSSVYFSSSTVLASLSLGTFLLRHPFKTWARDSKRIVSI